MKEIKLAIIRGAAIFVALSSLAVAGCNKDVRAPQFGVIEESQSFPEGKEALKLDFRFEYITWYSDAHVMRTIQASQIADFFGPEFLSTDPLQSSKAWAEAMADSTSMHGSDWAGGGTLDMHSSSKVVDDRIVTFTIHRNEEASMAAHPLETTRYANYDLRSGARLMLRDIFTPEGLAALPEKIRAEILAKHGATNWDELVAKHCYNAAETIAPTENFLLARESITFMYNPYDIACYAGGATEVTIPLSGLAGFNNDVLKK